ncbi:alpha/beta hydrolase [Dyadobacter sp. UC 10]|nr:alpha/beta hydrolase [Dyadobacter sp. UC 10]
MRNWNKIPGTRERRLLVNRCHLWSVVVIGCFWMNGVCVAQTEIEIPLYASKVPNSIPATQPEKRTFNAAGQLTALSKVIAPRLIVFRPAAANGTGIIICPGGGYRNLNIENVRFIAQRLNKMGITAFVLTYRLPADSLMVDKSVGAMQDIQQAFRVVRKMAAEWKLSRIGVWGSSAGGHLAAMAATHWNKAYETGKDTANLRPDFAVLAWPVITFNGSDAHKGSVQNLLGSNATEAQIREFSPEESVDAQTPPTFLVHAGDDPTVSFQNSMLFYQALKKQKVPTELHIYEEKTHGFGINPEVKHSWMSQLEIWLTNRGLIPSNTH